MGGLGRGVSWGWVFGGGEGWGVEEGDWEERRFRGVNSGDYLGGKRVVSSRRRGWEFYIGESKILLTRAGEGSLLYTLILRMGFASDLHSPRPFFTKKDLL